jgi:hypothetical protein
MPHNDPKRSQLRYTKKPYRIRNWRDGEAALRRRGEPTLWFSEVAIEARHAGDRSKPGGQRIYSDLAIGTTAPVRSVYRLGPRQILARISQIDHNFTDLGRRFLYKNQYVAAMLGARSWRTRWVKRDWGLSGSISIGA